MGEPFEPTSFSSAYSTRGNRTARTYESEEESEASEEEFSDDQSSAPLTKSRRRGNLEDDDDEWVLDTPRKYIKKSEREKGGVKSCSGSETKKVEPQKIIVKTTDPGVGQIRKNIIFCNRVEPSPIQVQTPTFNMNMSGGSCVGSVGSLEVSPEKTLLATKLKLKVAQKTGISDEQLKHHKLQVSN